MPLWHMKASHQSFLGVSSPRVCAVGGCLLRHSKRNLHDWKPDSVLLLLLLERLQFPGHWAGVQLSSLSDEEYSYPSSYSHYHKSHDIVDNPEGADGVCAAGPMCYFLLKYTALGPGQAFLLSPSK